MKHPFTGLYHYCDHLARALIRTAISQHRLCFYLPAALKSIFGEDQCYLYQRSIHKYLFPSLNNVAVWHCTHQDTDYFPRSTDLKVVLTIHDLNYLHDASKADVKKKRFAAQLQAKIDRSHYIVAISDYTLRDVEQHFSLGSKPRAVIHNGCNIEPMPQLALPQYVPQAPFLFTLGAVTDKKNFHVLPALLVGNSMHLVIAGVMQSRAYQDRIRQEATLHGVADRVIFTGPVGENDKQWYLSHCTAFVFPSIAEGFGLPVVEAMYFGKPVFLSTCTSLPEVGGDAAYYFTSFEPGTMQQVLKEGLENFEAGNRKEQVRARAASFSWMEAAEKYHGVYDELLAGK
ncbi:MAG TPA: glycosyltransferase family 1 protein [Flavisolibacter sp.]